VWGSPEQQTGEIGAIAVTANFLEIGWGPVVHNRPHDLGTDLFVQAFGPGLFSHGLFVGVQVKAGSSYFKDPAYDEDGALIGWWYDEPNTRHFDDWVRHGLPHLLVLHDSQTHKSYWVHVTAKAVQVTGKGAKVLVPAHQTIDEAHLDDLLVVSATQKQAIPLEGTAWTAGASGIAPGHRLRHALLVPRLVAPHRNAGFAAAIGPEEAVALLVQGRVGDFELFAEKHDSVPGLDDAGSSRDWRWRFVAAVGRRVTEGEATALAAAVEDAPTPASRTAACVVTACALMDAERHDEAVALLSEQVERVGTTGSRKDASIPIDQAWALVQRARACAEIGEVAAARQDVATAQRMLVGEPDDFTASAIGAAAVSLLFRTAEWGEQRLEEVVAASDTAATWWRSQTLSWGLVDAADRHFRQWADEQAARIEFEDTVNNRLFAALVNADLTGDQGAWERAGSLLARNTLVDQHARGDAARQADALDELRRSGDDASLRLAARRLWNIGPLGPLSDAAGRIGPGSWTHTAASANLALWQHAGDLLEVATATSAARYCLEVLADPSAFVARTTPSFLVAPAILDALAGLIQASDDAVHRDFATLALSLPPIADEVVAIRLARVVVKLRAAALTPGDRVAWREAAIAQPHRGLAAKTLGLLAADDEGSRAQLLARVANGDRYALEALGDVRQLDAEVARHLTAEDAQAVEAIIGQAEADTFGLRSRDVARSLAVLGIWHRDAARWDVLLRFLAHERVAGEHKRDTCLVLADRADQLPEQVQSSLRDLTPRLSGIAGPPDDSFRRALGRPLAGAATNLAAAVGALDEQDITIGLAALLTGSRQDRCDAARLIVRLGRPEHTAALIALISDPHADVRAQAAQALAIRTASLDAGTDTLAVTGLRRALADPGALMPLAIASGITTVQAPTDQARELVTSLLQHSSARVREAAQSALPEGQSHRR
jgi:hypothetical protein